MKRYLLLAVGSAVFCAYASAGIILDTGVGNNFTSRTTDGPGQGVSVGVNTTLTQIGFYMNAPDGGDIKFMIWNGTNTSLLFSTTQSIGASNTLALVLSNPFSFNLLAGNTYYFGILSDTAENVSYFGPAINLTQNNLTLVNPNTNYATYASPSFEGSAGATIALQLVGGGDSPVPEPATVGLVGLGCLGIVAARGKFRARTRR